MHTQLTKNTIKYKILPILALVTIIIFSLCLSIQFVRASGFASTSSIWEGETDCVEASSSTYPYSDIGRSTGSRVEVKKVSLNILYGINRDLVTYRGELPWAETHKDEGDTLDGWSGYPYQEDTSSKSGTNPSYGAATSPDAKAYWGDIPDSVYSDGNFKSVGEAEKINNGSGGVVSLRLYALQHTSTDWWLIFGHLFYFLFKGLAWLASMFVTLVVMAKNIDMKFIMSALKLDTIGEALTKSFVINGVSISPFMGFCLIMFIFAVVAYTIKWVKGSEKTNSIWKILGTALLGFIILGVCILGQWSSLGGTISNAACKIMKEVATSFTTGAGGGEAFAVDIEDDDNDNYIVQLSELSLVYKPFIDIQLCTQFGVTSVDNLCIDSSSNAKLGGLDTSYLAGIDSSTNFKEEFNNNLGYYFWFANSSASKKTSYNKTLPDTKAGVAEEKLSSMITALQNKYNTADDTQKDDILNMIQALSLPQTGTGILLMLGYTIVLVILGLVLIKYAINVLIAKLELFVALLGLTIAGPLMISNNKKLVQTGKFILGMLLISFLEITVWSIFFDLIIYTVGIMLQATLPSMLVTIAFLLLFLHFNPYIAQKVKELLDTTTRSVSPVFHQGRNQLKQSIRRGMNDVVDRVDNRKPKIVGYDENGNAITKSRKGDLMSRMAHMASNSLEDAHSRKSWSKLGSRARADRKNAKDTSNKALRQAADAKVKNVQDNIAIEAEQQRNEITSDAKNVADSMIERDTTGNIIRFDASKLDAEEVRMNNELLELKSTRDALKEDPEYRLLKEEAARLKKDGLSLSPDKQKRLNELTKSIDDYDKQISDKQQEISKHIEDRALRDVANRHGYKIGEDEDIEDALTEQVNLNVQEQHSAQLKDALEEAIKLHGKDINNAASASSDGKVNGVKTSKVNKEAVVDYTTAKIMLDELKHGQVVSSTEDIKDTAEAIAEQVHRNKQTLSGRVSAHAYRGNLVHHKVKDQDRVNNAAIKANTHNVTMGGISINEQVDALVKHRKLLQLKNEDKLKGDSYISREIIKDKTNQYRQETIDAIDANSEELSHKQADILVESTAKAEEQELPKVNLNKTSDSEIEASMNDEYKNITEFEKAPELQSLSQIQSVESIDMSKYNLPEIEEINIVAEEVDTNVTDKDIVENNNQVINELTEQQRNEQILLGEAENSINEAELHKLQFESEMREADETITKAREDIITVNMQEEQSIIDARNAEAEQQRLEEEARKLNEINEANIAEQKRLEEALDIEIAIRNTANEELQKQYEQLNDTTKSESERKAIHTEIDEQRQIINDSNLRTQNIEVEHQNVKDNQLDQTKVTEANLAVEEARKKVKERKELAEQTRRKAENVKKQKETTIQMATQRKAAAETNINIAKSHIQEVTKYKSISQQNIQQLNNAIATVTQMTADRQKAVVTNNHTTSAEQTQVSPAKAETSTTKKSKIHMTPTPVTPTNAAPSASAAESSKIKPPAASTYAASITDAENSNVHESTKQSTSKMNESSTTFEEYKLPITKSIADSSSTTFVSQSQPPQPMQQPQQPQPPKQKQQSQPPKQQPQSQPQSQPPKQKQQSQPTKQQPQSQSQPPKQSSQSQPSKQQLQQPSKQQPQQWQQQSQPPRQQSQPPKQSSQSQPPKQQPQQPPKQQPQQWQQQPQSPKSSSYVQQPQQSVYQPQQQSNQSSVEPTVVSKEQIEAVGSKIAIKYKPETKNKPKNNFDDVLHPIKNPVINADARHRAELDRAIEEQKQSRYIADSQRKVEQSARDRKQSAPLFTKSRSEARVEESIAKAKRKTAESDAKAASRKAKSEQRKTGVMSGLKSVLKINKKPQTAVDTSVPVTTSSSDTRNPADVTTSKVTPSNTTKNISDSIRTAEASSVPQSKQTQFDSSPYDQSPYDTQYSSQQYAQSMPNISYNTPYSSPQYVQPGSSYQNSNISSDQPNNVDIVDKSNPYDDE